MANIINQRLEAYRNGLRLEKGEFEDVQEALATPTPALIS